MQADCEHGEDPCAVNEATSVRNFLSIVDKPLKGKRETLTIREAKGLYIAQLLLAKPTLISASLPARWNHKLAVTVR